MPRARVHLHVSGRVQGVFFRARAKEKADELGVVGWVRNLPDGRVEAVAEGERSAVEALVEWCRQGPPGARVERLDADWAEPSGEFARFETRYH